MASPSIVYFTSFSPPLLPETAILASMLAAGIFFTAFTRGDRDRDSNMRLAKECFLLFAVFLIFYIILLNFSTVPPPEGSNLTKRFQIGFGKEDWSLTPEGRDVKSASPNDTIQQWMLDDGLFREGGPQVLWTDWSIYLAGGSLIGFFLLIFTLCNFALGLIALEHARESRAP